MRRAPRRLLSSLSWITPPWFVGVALAAELPQRAIVIREVDVLVGRGRLPAPLALDFRAQGEDRLESLHVEARVGGEAEAGLHERSIRALRGLRVLLEAGGDEGDHRVAMRRIARPADRLDVGRDVALEHGAVRLRPPAHHEGAAGLVGADEV